MTKTRTDCVGEIVEYISNLNQICRCVRDSLKSCDIYSALDCTYKFYVAQETISTAISMYRGVLSVDEIMKYHTTVNKIAAEMRAESLELAKKCKCVEKN